MDADDPRKAITKAVRELRKINENISELPNVVLNAAQRGVTIAKDEMTRKGIPTSGQLGSSINAYMSSIDTATLEADAGHATFVEFGTGIVGENKPHPEATERGVSYDVNGHGESGWDYYKNGRFYHTKGYRSRPFWYATGKKLKTLVDKLVKKKLKIKDE